jgi:hypothetical protein
MNRTVLSALIVTYSSVFSTTFAQDQEAVFTLYFSGTGMTGDMWEGESSAFGRPETVATLHHFQQVESDGQHKGIVDGFSGIEMVNPNWSNTSRSAIEKLEPVFDQLNCSKCITLNLMGFSRGGVSTMYLAHQLSADPVHSALNDKIRKINILVFDPVPGAITLSSANFNLPSNVGNFIGFYSEDERSNLFSPVFPKPASIDGSLATHVHLFSVPGSHETMVGSIKEDGHAHNDNFLGREVEDIDSLNHLSRALKLVIRALLGSPEWGEVQFETGAWSDTADANQLKSILEEEISAIYEFANIDLYANMRNQSFLDPTGIFSPTEAWSSMRILGEACRLKLDSASTNARCVYVEPFDGMLGFPNSSLEGADKIVPLNGRNEDGEYGIWRLIESYN